MKIAPGLRQHHPDIESLEALRFACQLYVRTREHLKRILHQRMVDRAFIDGQCRKLAGANRRHRIDSEHYRSVLGMQDEHGRIVVGRQAEECQPAEVTPCPDWMGGFHVTLFGPPDTPKMSINAMNSIHRIPSSEAPIVRELVHSFSDVPRWGADSEDAKTPIMQSLLRACENLKGCFDRSLTCRDERSGSVYRVEDSNAALPIKRIPGLALPDGNHLLNGSPLPLHLFDFAMHVFHNRACPEALMFYIPKLENEEEANYVHELVRVAEDLLIEADPAYEPGTIRLLVVFENPRAIFRIREIAQELAPYFMGGSLGWHDFLASTARLFRHDPNYRIPVKADPDIVINHIRESHRLLVESLRPINGIAIGGMYGVLYKHGNEESYQASMIGYIKDVVTQLKRGLQGFWVAHPDFVRPGMALVEAFRRKARDQSDESLEQLVRALIVDPVAQDQLLKFINGPDVEGLPRDDPRYERAVIAATLHESTFLPNHHPDEVRYNVFQALQYLADWLSGNGCVALPATLNDRDGNPVFVRVMDDLATTERSRWELWAEVNHGRVTISAFERILTEEIDFIRNDRATTNKRVQVKWDGQAAIWYPIAAKLLWQLVTDPEPVEFVTELLMPFTLEFVRDSSDPWRTANQFHADKYIQSPSISV